MRNSNLRLRLRGGGAQQLGEYGKGKVDEAGGSVVGIVILL